MHNAHGEEIERLKLEMVEMKKKAEENDLSFKKKLSQSAREKESSEGGISFKLNISEAKAEMLETEVKSLMDEIDRLRVNPLDRAPGVQVIVSSARPSQRTLAESTTVTSSPVESSRFAARLSALQNNDKTGASGGISALAVLEKRAKARVPAQAQTLSKLFPKQSC